MNIGDVEVPAESCSGKYMCLVECRAGVFFSVMLVSVTWFLSSIRVQICNVWDITGPAVEMGGWNRLKGMSLFWLHVGMGWGGVG